MADNVNTTDISNKLVDVAGLEHFWNKTEEGSYVTAAALIDLNDRLEQYKNDIDFTPIENKIDEGINTLSEKIDDIDLSSVAKQGENQEATNTKIYNCLNNIDNNGIAKLNESAGLLINLISEKTAFYDSTTGNLTIENVNITIQ